MDGKLEGRIAQGGTNVSGVSGSASRSRGDRAPPRVLVFDDSFSALDLTTDARLRAALWAELPEVTKIVVAQRVSTITGADRIVVLEDDAWPDSARMTSCCARVPRIERSSNRSWGWKHERARRPSPMKTAPSSSSPSRPAELGDWNSVAPGKAAPSAQLPTPDRAASSLRVGVRPVSALGALGVVLAVLAPRVWGCDQHHLRGRGVARVGEAFPAAPRRRSSSRRCAHRVRPTSPTSSPR